jgi:predicted RND superfamily exporter protein
MEIKPALQRVITKVGTATLMTNLTTAAGFATLSLPIVSY